jgi:hypothetical protein
MGTGLPAKPVHRSNPKFKSKVYLKVQDRIRGEIDAREGQ